MEIYLEDISINESQRLNLEVGFSVPTNDLMVIFYTENQRCGLLNGKDSAPYSEYNIRKVSFIIGGKIRYKSKVHNVLLGFCLAENRFLHFLIDEQAEEAIFQTYSDFIDYGVHTKHKLFNYKEYVEYQQLLNEPIKPFKDYLQDIIVKQDEGMNGYFALFDIPKEKKILVNNKEFVAFLDKEEKLSNNG